MFLIKKYFLAFLVLGYPLSIQASIHQQSEAISTLPFGAPLERQLSGGQSHQYQVTLTAGQFLQLTVEQLGVDIVLKVLGPDGRQLLESDGPGGAQSIETA